MATLSEIQDACHALNALSDFLVARDYCERARVGARTYVHLHGTLFGCPHIDPGDLEAATEVLALSFPDVPQDDESWADDGRWTPNDVFSIVPPELDDDGPDAPDEHITREPGYREALERDGITLMPISGGSPEFTPSDEDWASYRDWSESLDRLDEMHQDEPECRYGYE